MGLSDARLTQSLERKAGVGVDVGRRKGGKEAAMPALLITLDLLEMLMSCWVIAHVCPGPWLRGNCLSAV